MRHQEFTHLYDHVVRHLRLRSNLTDKKIRDLAAKGKFDARMVRDTPEDAKAFLKAYRAGLVREERANIRSRMKIAVEKARQSGDAELFTLLQHEANNMEEDQMRDFLNRLQPSLRSFIEPQVRRPSSMAEMESYVNHWCDMSHGRMQSSGRINELSSVPNSTGEPSVHPGPPSCLLYTSDAADE